MRMLGAAHDKNTEDALRNVFTFDFVMSFLFAVSTILFVPFILNYQERDALLRPAKDRQNFSISGGKDTIQKWLYPCVLFLYFYGVLHLSGNLSLSPFWHLLQAFILMALYTFYLVNKKEEY